MKAKSEKGVERARLAYEDTTVNISPLTVDEVLEALLKTPPPQQSVDVAKPKRQRVR